MIKGNYKLNPYSNTPYRLGTFNPKPYSSIPLNSTPLIINPYNPTPFTPTPYTINPYNQDNLRTAFERIDYLRDMRMELPNKYARNYLNRHNSYQEYLKAKQNETSTESLLANYNDALEVNSLRDILLGAANPYMKHGLRTGIGFIDANATYNIIADTIVHSWKHFLKPMVKGEFSTAGINLLQGLSEDMDTVVNPVKALFISAFKGDNVGQALLRSTFGDETGIHNYNYDTGNMALDILLEVVSDPMTWVTFGSSGALKGVGGATLKGSTKGVSEGLEQTAKAVTKASVSAADDIASEAIQGVVQEGTEKLLKEQTGGYIKKATQKINNILLDPKAYAEAKKQLNNMYQHLPAQARKAKVAEMLQEQIYYNAKLQTDQIFTKTFGNVVDDTATGAKIIINGKIPKEMNPVVFDKLVTDGSIQAIKDATDDVLHAYYLKMSNSIVASLGRTAKNALGSVDNLLIKGELSLAGVFPVYKFIKSDTVQDMMHNQLARAISTVTPNKILDATENITDLGAKRGAIETAQRQIDINQLASRNLKVEAPQQVATAVSIHLVNTLDNVKQVLKNNGFDTARKEKAILNYLQSISCYTKIESIDDFLTVLKKLDSTFKNLDGEQLLKSGFEQYIDEFTKINKVVKNMYRADNAVSKIVGMSKDVASSKAIKQLNQLEIFDDYSVEEILEAVEKNELVRSTLTVNKTVLDLDIKGYQQALQGTLTTAEEEAIKDNILKNLQKFRTTVELSEAPVFKKVKKDLDQVFNNMTTKTGKLRSGVINNLQNISNFIKAQHSTSEFVDRLNKLDPRLYEAIFYTQDEVLGTAAPKTLNNRLIEILKQFKDYTPSAEKTFNDSGLAKWVKDIDYKYNNLNDFVYKMKTYNDENIKHTLSENTIKSNFKRASKLTEYNTDTIKKTVEYKYDLPTAEKMARDLLSDKDYQKLFEYRTIEDYFNNLRDHMEVNKVVLSEAQETTLEALKDSLEYYSSLLSKMSTASRESEAFFKAKYYDLYTTHNTIIYNYNRLRSIIERQNPLDTKVDTLRPTNITSNLDSVIAAIDRFQFDLVEQAELVIQHDADYMFLQVEKSCTQNLLNQVFAEAMQDPNLNAMLDHIVDRNHHTLTELYSTYNPDTQYVLSFLGLKRDGAKNMRLLNQNIDNFVESVPKSQLPEHVDLGVAIRTTLQNYANRNMKDIKLNDLINDITYRIQGYTNGADPFTKSYKLDMMNKKLGIQEADVLKELKKVKGLEDVESARHSALYDTMNQIMVFEKETGKTFEGYMLDTETTQLLKNNWSNGKMTEIALLRKHNGVYETIYNGKIQLSKELLENEGYITLPSVWENLGLTKQEYIAKYLNESGTVNEEVMLREFFEKFRNIEAHETVMTYNGDNFDLIYLQNKLAQYHIEANVIAQDKKLIAKNKMLKLFNTRRHYTFSEICEQLNMRDYYQELSKNRYALTSTQQLQLKDIIEQHLINQNKLEMYAQGTNKAIKFYEGVDSDTLNTLRSLINLDELQHIRHGSDWMQQYEDVLNYVSETFSGEHFDLDLEILDTAKSLKLGGKIFKDSVDPQIREILYNVYESYIETVGDVGILNQQWRDVPIPSYLFDELDTRYSKEALQQYQKLIAESLPENSEFRKVFEENIFTNFTQLVTYGLEGDPMLAYKKVSGSTWALLDTSDVTVTTNNAMVFENFARKITANNDSIRNLRCLVPEKENIKALLQDIKASGLIEEAKVLRITDDELQFNFAELKTIWDKVKFRAENGIDTHYAAVQLVEDASKKYSRLMEILDEGTPFIKIHSNTNKLEVILPPFSKFQNTLEKAITEAISNKNMNIIDKIKTMKNTAGHKLEYMNTLDTVSTWLTKLNNHRLNSFDKFGNPTKLTDTLNDMGKRANQGLPAWNLNQIMQLDAKSLRDEIIASSSEHIKTFKMPTNKYYNNRVLFEEFISRKSELADVGVKLNFDKETQRITLSLDTDMLDIRLNKNKGSAARYICNGEEVIAPRLQEMSLEDFKKLVGGNEEYAELLYGTRQKLIELNPDLSGRWGLTYYAEQYKAVNNNTFFPSLKWSSKKQGDDFIPFLDDIHIGEFDSVTELAGPLNTDYFETINQLANKMLNHTHKHLEYGQFIMQGGIRLDSEYMLKMSDAEIKAMLDAHPDYRIVGLFDQPNAVGGYEIKALTNPSVKKIAEARTKGLTIIPYNLYASAAQAINNYSYSNKFLAGWGKVISMYKQGWLLNPGVVVRNFIDSGLKNIAEGQDIPTTVRNYIQANDLLQKYDKALYEIKMYDSVGRYRLENAEKYFDLPNCALDRDTFHFMYDFLEDSGISSLSTDQGLFARLMQPNSNIERLARLTQYLNLEGQGKQYTEIINHIARTHFDYNTKTYADFVFSQIIPFHTYITNNINYVAHLIDENPSFLRNYFNVYTPIWDFDSLDYEELSQNQSLQYQILNGNIPLKLFGYKDKEITHTINTKYGPQEQKVTNTAVLRMGSSFLDGLSFFVSPFMYIKEKLAPPIQSIMDTTLEFCNSALGNSEQYKWDSQQETDKNYQRNFGSTSVQSLFRDPTNLTSLLPFVNTITQRYMHKEYSDEGNSFVWGSTTGVRTDNQFLGSLPSIFGATSRWGEFTNELSFPRNKLVGVAAQSGTGTGRGYMPYPKRVYARRVYPRKTYARKTYPKKSYARKSYARKTYARQTYARKFYPGSPRVNQGMSYRFSKYGNGYAYYTGYPGRSYTSGKRPYSKYESFIYNIQHPNFAHRSVSQNNSGHMQSVPKYLHSYMGKNRQGKSKVLSWMRMTPRYKVKSTLRRYATP